MLSFLCLLLSSHISFITALVVKVALLGFIRSTSDVLFSSKFQQHNFWHNISNFSTYVQFKVNNCPFYIQTGSLLITCYNGVHWFNEGRTELKIIIFFLLSHFSWKNKLTKSCKFNRKGTLFPNFVDCQGFLLCRFRSCANLPHTASYCPDHPALVRN